MSRKSHKRAEKTVFLDQITLILRGKINAGIGNIQIRTVGEREIVRIELAGNEFFESITTAVELKRDKSEVFAAVIHIGNVRKLPTLDHVGKKHIFTAAAKAANTDVAFVKKTNDPFQSHRLNTVRMTTNTRMNGARMTSKLKRVEIKVNVNSMSPVKTASDP